MNWIRSLGIWDFALLAIIILFTIIKIPFLDHPYFWDEAWVYAPAVFDMYENGVGLLPSSVNPELSRGHPILFHFFAALWMSVFGTTFVAVHAFSLFVSVLLLVAVYALGVQLLNRSTGFWAAGLLAIQPIFLEQSGFLLPEVQLALFTVLTILFYLRRSIVPFIFSGTCLLLTKETGILTIGVIGLVELFQFAADREWTKQRIAILFSTAAPILLAFVYFLIQRFQFGWFMFPEHMGMFDTEADHWKHNIGTAINIIFREQQRGLIVTTGLAVIGLGWTRGPVLARSSAVLLALSFVTMKGLSSWLPEWYFEYGLPVVLVVFGLSMMRPFTKAETINHLFFPIVLLLMLVMILFTSAHYFIDRYFMFLFPLMFLAISAGMHIALKQAVWLKNVLLIFLGFMVYHHTNRIDSKQRWNNLRYTECINVTRRCADYLQEHGNRDSDCVASSFTFIEVMKKPTAGYITEQTAFGCLSTTVRPETDYIIQFSYEPLHDMEVSPDELPEFEQVWKTEDGSEWGAVYKRKSP